MTTEPDTPATSARAVADAEAASRLGARRQRAPARGIGLGLVFLFLAGTLLIGQAIKAPCVTGDWGDGRPFTRLCATDIVHLLGPEQLTEGRLPYLDPCDPSLPENCDEYPVLMMWTMRLTAWVSGPDDAQFYVWNSVILGLVAFWIAWCLYQMVGPRALYFAAAPTLVIYATYNWDLLAVGLTTAATLAFLRGRDIWSGLLLGLATATKFFPGFLVVPFAVAGFRDRADRGIRLAWAAATGWVLVNGPFMIAAPLGWWEFFRINTERPAAFDSIWFIACDSITEAGCPNTRLINVLSAASFVGGVVLVWRLKAHRDPGFPRWTLGFPIIALFLVTNKVYSPQYSLWILPWFALALPTLRWFLAFEIADVAVFVTEFSWFGTLNGMEGGLAGDVTQGMFEVAFVARFSVLLLCIAAWVRTRAPAVLPVGGDLGVIEPAGAAS